MKNTNNCYLHTLLVALFISLGLTAFGSSALCAPSSLYYRPLNKCFWKQEERTTFRHARAKCAQQGGDLATFEIQGVINWTYTFLRLANTSFYIGLIYNQTQFVYNWMDGKPLRKCDFKAWQDDPDPEQGYYCVVMTDRTWRSVVCDKQYPAICQAGETTHQHGKWILEEEYPEGERHEGTTPTQLEAESEDRNTIISEDKINLTSKDKNNIITCDDKNNITSEDKNNITSEDKNNITSEDKNNITSEDKNNITSEDKNNGNSSAIDKAEAIGSKKSKKMIQVFVILGSILVTFFLCLLIYGLTKESPPHHKRDLFKNSTVVVTARAASIKGKGKSRPMQIMTESSVKRDGSDDE